MKRIMTKILMALAVTACAIMAQPLRASEAADTITLESELLPYPMQVTVVTPMTSASHRFPTLYLLNGYGNLNHKAWGTVTDLQRMANEKEWVIVCPSGYNTWYYDVPMKPEIKMESFITRELVAAIDSLYPTIPTPEMRAITGFSMGGHGALWMAIRNPGIFGSAGASSGGVDITPFPKNWNLPDLLGPRDDNPEFWREHTVKAAVDTLTPGRLNIVFDCGTEDFFYPVNCSLDSLMNARRIPHQFFTMPGAHNGEYWGRSILRQAEFFDRIFRQVAIRKE